MTTKSPRAVKNESEPQGVIVISVARSYRLLKTRPKASLSRRAQMREIESAAVEIDVNDRRRVKGEHLADDQAADNGDAEGPPELGTNARSERQRQSAEQRRQSGHHDRPKAQQAGLINRVTRIFSLVALGLERKVDHHDRILLDDADKKNNPDQRDDAQIRAAKEQRQKCAQSR